MTVQLLGVLVALAPLPLIGIGSRFPPGAHDQPPAPESPSAAEFNRWLAAADRWMRRRWTLSRLGAACAAFGVGIIAGADLVRWGWSP